MVIAVALAACAPTVDGPLERSRAADREDARALEAQLAKLPGAASATVTLHRPARDPLGVSPPSSAAASVLLVVDDATDRAAITASATTLVRAAAPEVSAPAIVVAVGVHRAQLVDVGPFVVDKRSAGALKAALAIALAVIAALAGWIALRERRAR